MERPVAQNQVALPDIPSVGEILVEKYRVEEILGVGGMGVVLAARHLQLGQSVAIKVLAVSQEQRSDAIERFLREGRAAAALQSDHVVRIYDVGQLPSGLPFMVMERLRGQDLATLLQASGPLAIADALEYVAQATMAIVDAHEVGIVHRDLKPANLFRTQRSDGSVCIKVLDFGISKQLTDLETQTLQGALTSTRQVMGSPAYMSPEQVRDAKNVDHRTDIWALGVTLYELLTQHAAFDADTLPAICAAIAADPPIPIRTRRAEVPDSVVAIVERCLEKQPANRFPTARALLRALRAAQGASTDPASGEVSSPATQTNVALDPGLQKDKKLELPWNDSGTRSVGSVSLVGSDGTLVSGRIAAQAQPAEAASKETKPNRLRRLAAIALVLLVGGGAGTAWFVARGSGARVNAADVATPPESPKPGAAEAAKAPSQTDHSTADRRMDAAERDTKVAPVEARERFVLRIDSNPSQALVLEAGNPLGVTPLSIDVDRTVVRRNARQFVLRKPGYRDVTIQQSDSTGDVQQNVTLARTRDAAPEARPVAAPQRASTVAAPQRASTAPAPTNSAPGIRISR